MELTLNFVNSTNCTLSRASYSGPWPTLPPMEIGAAGTAVAGGPATSWISQVRYIYVRGKQVIGPADITAKAAEPYVTSNPPAPQITITLVSGIWIVKFE
jgi:hypothetical protein